METYITNDHFIVSGLDNPFCTHFGVVPEYTHIQSREDPAIMCGWDVHGAERRHVDPNTETMLWRGPGVTAWVSGSWMHWGPQDQATEGDDSLHVAVYTPTLPDEHLLRVMYDSLVEDVEDGRGVVLDHAYITRRDHSERSHVVTFSNGVASRYQIAKQA